MGVRRGLDRRKKMVSAAARPLESPAARRRRPANAWLPHRCPYAGRHTHRGCQAAGAGPARCAVHPGHHAGACTPPLTQKKPRRRARELTAALPRRAENHRQVLHQVRPQARCAPGRLREEVHRHVHGPIPGRDGASVAGVGGADEAAGGHAGRRRHGRRLPIASPVRVHNRHVRVLSSARPSCVCGQGVSHGPVCARCVAHA